MEIGAQLYTLRDFCKTLNSFEETLKRVADIGYKNIQISGTCEYDAQWLASKLKENGLKCVLTHINSDKLCGDTLSVVKDHNVLDCKYVGLGYYPFNEDNENENYANFVNKYSPVMEALKENGKYFMYHNHDFEFKKYNNEIILEKLQNDFSADKLGFTLDTFWVQAGGGDPAYWIEKLNSRVPCIHLKDFAYGRKMAVIGEGNINFDRVFEKAEVAGTKYMLVEQDDCNGEAPLVCLKRSFDYLKSRGFT